ncbi:MAG TPA: nuclear transport factor 2 family protein, partial [Gemmatimonadota bacterium]|nr:nuclear transport factor 2 family protein [Gemmatimonadota bacterium]
PTEGVPLLRAAIPFLVGLLAFAPSRAGAQSAADSMDIRQAALDYIEGYYDGDAMRMERALHPELAKRIVRADSTGVGWISSMGASQLIAGTRAGSSREIPEADRKTIVTILDVFQNVASAKIDAGPWIDYLHLARVNGRWVIINVLWELLPRSAS